MSNPRCYYRIGVTLMVIGCVLTVWGAFQMPRAVAAAVIALMLCAAGIAHLQTAAQFINGESAETQHLMHRVLAANMSLLVQAAYAEGDQG